MVKPATPANPSPIATAPVPAPADEPRNLPPPEPQTVGSPAWRHDCAQLSCIGYSSPHHALAHPALEKARVLGFGEAHAPSGYEGRTTARRFTEELLPTLAPRSKRLLVELLAPPSGCEEPRKDVQAESDAVTEGQAEHNQNDYLEMGHAARKLGVVPDVLRPSCKDMQAIAAAEVRVLSMMATIANLTADVAQRWLSEPAAERPQLLLYGGALHNDVSPRQNLETWSYGPRLAELSGHGYVEVDLVLPELVSDTESWRKFPWYGAVRSLPPDHGTTLVEVSEESFALVFAAQPK